MRQEIRSDEPRAVFRFAPSPNGRLHLGHAYSALLNQMMAEESGGRLLLRIEDTDTTRCTPVLEQRMLEDLEWLGIVWETPPRRQSDQIDTYMEAVDTLRAEGLVYPAFMSRGQVREYIERETASGLAWPTDPDSAPHYPNPDRYLSDEEHANRIEAGEPHSLRLNMEAVRDFLGSNFDELYWQESGKGPAGQTGMVQAEPAEWGDIVLSRKDVPASYHLAVVIDDALQGVTHVVRGRDLFWSTSVHRVLQQLLGLPAPHYHHHDLVLDDDGKKLSKSRQDTSLAELRSAGATPVDIRKMVGLG